MEKSEQTEQTARISGTFMVFVMVSIFLWIPSLTAVAQENVALYKPTKQTNIFEGGHSNRAVDGNTSGNWGHVSMSHTHGANNPYWEVDLLDTYDISEIKIYNRTDCCPERLNNFTIRVSDEPIGGTNTGTIYNPGNKQTFRDSKTFSGNARGRYVNIRIEGNGILALGEVEVFGELFSKNATEDLNLALGKKSRQSSTFDHSSSQRANDGDTDGNWNNGSVSYTHGESSPFWEVDLGESYGITSVQVYNRTDYSPESLRDFKIWVSDKPLENIQGNTEKYIFATQTGALDTRYRDYKGRKVGRYVRIQIEGNSILGLAEVKVFGHKVGDLVVGSFENIYRYNVAIVDNANGATDPIKFIRTNVVTKGYDFNRTVNKTDESFWKLGSEVSTTFDIFGQGVDVTVTAEGGETSTNSVTDSQGGSLVQSTSNTIELETKVPPGCVRYEFHKWKFKQTPIEYNINGKTFSWYNNNDTPEYITAIKIFVFPIDQVPEMLTEKISKDNWIEEADFDEFYDEFKVSRYIIQE